MLVDSHAHLNFADYQEELGAVLDRAREFGVEKIINIGTSLKDSEEAIELAQTRDGLFAAVGLHPNDNPILHAEVTDWEKFEQLARNPKVAAIGECGLDYSRLTGDLETRNLEKKRQYNLFDRQIAIAEKLAKPLSIHIRDAQTDIMTDYPDKLSGLSGVFHCFSGEQDYLDFVLAKLPGFYLSFAGNLTFKNAQKLRDLAGRVPLNRLLVETDCPFLAPEPYRGQKNEPANVKITAVKLAEVLGLDLEKISAATSDNAARLFRI